MNNCRIDNCAQSLYYKLEWPQAQKRWTAFWERAEVDRPCIDVKAPKQTDLQPPSEPDSLEDLYFDPEYMAKKWHYLFESTYFGGEAVPSGGALMGGYALGCGPDVKFARTTVWHPVLMSSIDEPIKWHPGPEDPWRHKLTNVITQLLKLAPGRFLVGTAGQVPVNDLLALIRGVEGFLMDLADDCNKCCRKLKELFPLWLENFEYFLSLVEGRQEGYVYNWPGLWSKNLVKLTQSDISCMLSRDMFDHYVMCEMDLLGEYYDCIWYHVDGPGAIRHVSKLLTRPYIKAIQYVPGSGDPPNGEHYMVLYQQVQNAGRCLDIAVPLENMEFLIRHLRPEGLILRTTVKSPEQAQKLLHNAVKWCGTHIKSYD